MLNLYEITIKPLSLFGTPLAGDTLFGHLCCQFALDEALLERPFADCAREYQEKPFLVVASAVPKIKRQGKEGYALPVPDLSLFAAGEQPADLANRLEKRKEMKKKKWFFAHDALNIRFHRDDLMDKAAVSAGIRERDAEAFSGKEAWMLETEYTHNSISRLTGTTGENFAPYTTALFSYLPGTTLAVFVLADSEICPPESLRRSFERIGAFGYGRDASTGMGRFAVSDLREKQLSPRPGANACYTLAPCVPPKGLAERADGVWARPLTRFGKHGAGVAPGGNPFKTPVVMAESGAVFRMATLPEHGFFGQGITGVSKARPETIVQGYAPVLPCTVKEA